MSRVLLCDGNNLAYRAFIVMYSGTGQLMNNLGVPTTVIFGVLRMLSNLTDTIPVDRCIVCWDGGSKYRKKIFKWYKHHREPAPWAEKYYEELNTARTYFEKIGLQQAYVKGIEADDVIGYLTAKFRETKDRVIILSDDKDFFQLAPYDVRIYRPTKMKLVDKTEMEEQLGFPPKLLPRIVAFTGEQKDNIPGIADLDDKHIMRRIGLGPKTVLKYLEAPDNKYLTVRQVLDRGTTQDRFEGLLKANYRQVLKSYKLSRIRTKDKYYEDWELRSLDDIYDKIMSDVGVRRSAVSNVAEYLELKNVNLMVTLKKLGVKLR